jgi:archaemetzincin
MHVDIVPMGDLAKGVKREASTALRSIYDCEVSVHDQQPVPDGSYDDSREQYRADYLIVIAYCLV